MFEKPITEHDSPIQLSNSQVSGTLFTVRFAQSEAEFFLDPRLLWIHVTQYRITDYKAKLAYQGRTRLK